MYINPLANLAKYGAIEQDIFSVFKPKTNANIV